MKSHRDTVLPFDLPAYTQLICQYDSSHAALWAYMDPTPRPCFTPTLLAEISDLQQRLGDYLRGVERDPTVKFLVYASAKEGVFNLGGDVNLFTKFITSQNRDRLQAYGRACIDALYRNTTGVGCPDKLTTIALVQGPALGGGFEGALSCNVVIAEEGVKMGFPEILFNLFPGMGALSLLSRRIHVAQAERFIQSGDLYSASALGEMGVVDEVAPQGTGVHAVADFIRRQERAANGRAAIRAARQRVNPVSYAELLDVVNIWVDAAMRLTARDLRTMHRLVAAQDRMSAGEDAAREVVRPLPNVTYARAVGE